MKNPATYTKTGTKASTQVKLDTTVFGIETTNHELLKQTYVSYLANGRINLAVTKTRGLVSGGGKKPWKQKGTGRARFGSSRVPIWRGGGITFGPTGLENYSKNMTVRSKRLALKQALSLKAADERIIVIENFAVNEPKTKLAVELLVKIGATKNSTLLVVSTKSDDIKRATSNISGVKLVSSGYLNTFDVLNADSIIFETDALTALYTRLITPRMAISL